MPNTYEAIATQTLGSTATSVTFSSIPGTYTDLVLVFAGTVATADNINVRFNGVSTGGLYSVTRLYGNGSTVASNRSSNQDSMQLGEMATVQSTDIIQIFNYSNSSTFKTVISSGRNTTGNVKDTVGLFRSTSAITSITLLTGGANYSAGSVFSLYGIAAA